MGELLPVGLGLSATREPMIWHGEAEYWPPLRLNAPESGEYTPGGLIPRTERAGVHSTIDREYRDNRQRRSFVCQACPVQSLELDGSVSGKSTSRQHTINAEADHCVQG